MKLLRKIITVLSIILFVFQIYIDVNPNKSLSITTRIIIVLLEVLGFILAYFMSKKDTNDEKYFKFFVFIMFVIYLDNLLYLLFFDIEMGRNVRIFNDYNYIKNNVNLVPFSSIKLYLKSYRMNYLPMSTIIINLLGNVVAFMPFAYFLPTLLKKQNNILIYFITMSLIIILVEFIQIITMCGSGDIDDYILNILGSLLMYVIIKFLRGIRK